MKALVTGATGFVGSAVVRELLQDGADVRIMLRKNSDTKMIEGLKDVEKVYGDVCDQASMETALKGCDTFFQTAALYEFWGPAKEEYYRVNVDGTRACLNAALKAGVQKVIHTSSVVALGSHGRQVPGNESSTFNLGKTGAHYAVSKHLAEVEALKFVDKGLPVVVVNPGSVIGAGDVRPTPSGRNITNVLNGKTPGYFDGGGNFVDVEDVAKGHLLAAKKGKVGEKYVLGNRNLSMREFLHMIADVGGVKRPGMKLPYTALLLTSYLYLLMAAINHKPPVVTPPLARLTHMYFYYDSSKAVKELGMPQTAVEKTIEKAVAWFRQNGYARPAPVAVPVQRPKTAK